MKRYHEVAHIKDGNKVVGYIVREGGLLDRNPYRIMDTEQFTRAVQANLVQYFVFESGRVVVKYTDEEMKVLESYKTPVYTGREYYQYDMSYTHQDITNLVKNGKGIFKICHIMNLPYVDKTVSSILFAPKNVIAEFNRLLEAENIYRSIFGSAVRYGGNWISFATNATDFTDGGFLSDISYKYTVDTKELFKNRTIQLPGVIQNIDEIKQILKSMGL